MKQARSGSRPVMIIGGGIAGPAVAIALRRSGIASVIYEATLTPRDQEGAFLNVAPNGLRVLETLGARSEVEAFGFQNDRLVFQNDTGRTLAEVAVGGVTILRGALSRVLREAATDTGIAFEHGKTLEAIDETPDGVVARFTDGSWVEGPALIGADGIHSRTRTSHFPEAPLPAYTGVLNLGGIVATDLPATGRTMRMVFGKRAFFGYAVRPSGHTYWFSNFSRPDEPARQELAGLDGTDYRDQLLDLHRDDPPDVIRILRAVHAQIGAYSVYDIMSLPRWHRGRVCLVGDAAHAVGPHAGQGSSLALEDAMVLARCLTAHDKPAAAFGAFERARRSRVEAVVKYSRRTGKQKVPRSWLGRRARDLVLPVFLRKGAEAAARLYEGEPVSA